VETFKHKRLNDSNTDNNTTMSWIKKLEELKLEVCKWCLNSTRCKSCLSGENCSAISILFQLYISGKITLEDIKKAINDWIDSLFDEQH